MKVGVVYDDLFLAHDPGYGHPERRERVEVLAGIVRGPRAVSELIVTPSRRAERKDLERVHERDHVDLIEATARRESVQLDGDTATSSGSAEAAMLAAGAGLHLLDRIADHEIDTGFAFVRPPGHHAEWDRAMGFCLYNNVAVLAAYARVVHHRHRVMIVDWDVHHGNGTQHMFEEDPSVLYLSTHRYPFYPGTGALHERGKGEGLFTTVNVPMPGGAGDAEYLAAFHEVVRPVVEAYRPDLMIVSAGFDPHENDPLGGMHVTAPTFGEMGALLTHAASDLGAPTVFVLEGGYDLDGLDQSVRAVLDRLKTETPPAAAPEHSRLTPILDAVKHAHEHFQPLAHAHR
ncbi:MAG: histone deacetylase [Deltaproteobacteria bacterium]|nr:histone deacetylase [Deltaproteobacteria bacterium]